MIQRMDLDSWQHRWPRSSSGKAPRDVFRAYASLCGGQVPSAAYADQDTDDQGNERWRVVAVVGDVLVDVDATGAAPTWSFYAPVNALRTSVVPLADIQLEVVKTWQLDPGLAGELWSEWGTVWRITHRCGAFEFPADSDRASDAQLQDAATLADAILVRLHGLQSK